MSVAKLEDVKRRARQSFDNACNVATEVICFSTEAYARTGRRKAAFESLMLQSAPEFQNVEVFHGLLAKGVILSVDIRKSSERAIRIGAKNTFITMHTFIPTLLEIVGQSEGKVIGLRGDGFLTSVGLQEIAKSGDKVDEAKGEKAMSNSCAIAQAMLMAVRDVVNPLLAEREIEELHIGVGIDFGEVVITNIGLNDATELTAYGPPVNAACKINNGFDKIHITHAANNWFKPSKGGKANVRQYGSLYIVSYGDDYTPFN